MKKAIVNVVVFVIVFCAAYLMLCFMVPGMRIKLAASAGRFFLESIRHAAPVKAAASAAAALITAAVSGLILKKVK